MAYSQADEGRGCVIALAMISVGFACVGAFSALWTLSEPVTGLYVRGMLVRWKMRRKIGMGMGSSLPKMIGATNRVKGAAAPISAVLRRHRLERARASERDRCLIELSELIDVVALGLSAGVSFDASLEIYCARYATTLSERLSQAMLSWRLGLASRKDALRALAARLDLAAFTTFVDTVTESLDFGAPLAQVLADQSRTIREERRAVVQERIEKAPVKMVVPTGALILPAMLLAILGPLLASLTEMVAR